MTQGVIVGGWQYVWMAYGLTFSAFAIYGVTLLVRLRDAARRESS
jgi:heme exporter protein D